MNYLAAKHFILDKLKRELPPQLTYHGLHHTLDVLAITKELCFLEEISASETMLLKTAALFHDSGFIISNVEHEKKGCHIARQHLPRFGYDNHEIEQICGMIMATKIPQNPQNFLEEIICDADLDYLGRDDFYTIGATLFSELKAYDILQTEQEWNLIQVKFLENHTFFTHTNRRRRAPRKAEYLDDLRGLVAAS
ncbi:MAG: HD domain-containing protein [Saprospiraceae bacterium]|nr:HD domain-containing protein [Lewinella sp.]